MLPLTLPHTCVTSPSHWAAGVEVEVEVVEVEVEVVVTGGGSLEAVTAGDWPSQSASAAELAAVSMRRQAGRGRALARSVRSEVALQR